MTNRMSGSTLRLAPPWIRSRETRMSNIGISSPLARIALVAAGFTLLGASLAQAGTPRCAPHADMLALLAKQYGKAPQAVAIANENHVIEVLSSKEGTFTIL